VIGAVGSVFLAGQQTYRSNEALSDVQESSRIAFEMLSRDIRNAGETGCDSVSSRVANALNNRATDWWAGWGNAVRGYEAGQPDSAVLSGTANTQRIATTDSIQLMGAAAQPVTIQAMTGPTANFTLNVGETSPSMVAGDIVMLCEPDHAALVKISGFAGGVISRTATDNCSLGVGYAGPGICPTTDYSFSRNAQLAELSAVDWYIGKNPLTGNCLQGGCSLYRKVLVNGAINTEEMVRNVTNMQISYLQSALQDFADAGSSINWAQVTAVKVILTLQSTDQRAGVDAKPLSRSVTIITTLRNRVF
jgi:type IV pilus assembly protein PilW